MISDWKKSYHSIGFTFPRTSLYDTYAYGLCLFLVSGFFFRFSHFTYINPNITERPLDNSSSKEIVNRIYDYTLLLDYCKDRIPPKHHQGRFASAIASAAIPAFSDSSFNLASIAFCSSLDAPLAAASAFIFISFALCALKRSSVPKMKSKYRKDDAKLSMNAI